MAGGRFPGGHLVDNATEVPIDGIVSALGLGALPKGGGELDFDITFDIDKDSNGLVELLKVFMEKLTLKTLLPVLLWNPPHLPTLRRSSIQYYERGHESQEELFRLALGTLRTTSRSSSVDTYRLTAAWTLSDPGDDGLRFYVRRPDCEAKGLGYEGTANAALTASTTSTSAEPPTTTVPNPRPLP